MPPASTLIPIRVEPLRDPATGQPLLVQATPDQRVIILPESVVPRLAVAEWQPVGGGHFRLVARRHDFYLEVTEAAKLVGLGYQSLLRLWRGDFVDGDRPTPKVTRVSLDSYFQHIAAVREDPEFWRRERNARRFRDAIRA